MSGFHGSRTFSEAGVTSARMSLLSNGSQALQFQHRLLRVPLSASEVSPMARHTRWRNRYLSVAFAMLTVTAGVASAAMANAATPPAPPAPRAAGNTGLTVHLFANGTEPEIAAQLKLIRRGGITTVRAPFYWTSIEPTKGTFRWASSDNFMMAAADAGVDVLPVLGLSTPWASSDPTGAGSQYYAPKPTEVGSFGDYATALARRYGPTGTFWNDNPSLKKDPLTAMEVWNEPWSTVYFKPDPDPSLYLKMAQAVAQGVRPLGVKVVISGDIWQTRAHQAPIPWLDTLLKADPTLPTWVGALSVHPYAAPAATAPDDPSNVNQVWGFGRLQTTKDTLAAHQASSIPIWITEVGWNTESGPDRISESAQAKYLGTAINLALTRYGVAKVFVFSWDDNDGMGVRRADGSAKPAWNTLTALLGGS
jgi:hypothetical protein